jgi:hypothetical protein
MRREELARTTTIIAKLAAQIETIARRIVRAETIVAMHEARRAARTRTGPSVTTETIAGTPGAKTTGVEAKARLVPAKAHPDARSTSPSA